MSVIRVKTFSAYNTSISFLWGKTPKVDMECGKCSYFFSKRFEPVDFRNGHPKAMCPSCNTVNYVPLSVS